MPLALVLVVVGLEVLCELVEGVVGEVSVEILLGGEVEGVGRGGEAGESFLVDVDAQRVPTGDADIDPHIELEAVGQERVVDVFTHDDAVLLLLQYLLGRVGQPDALALRAVVRLDDVPPLALLLLGVVGEHAGLVGQDEGLGEEVVLALEAVLHLGQILQHQVFPSQLK